MSGPGAKAAAIVILGQGSLDTARRIGGALHGAVVHGLRGRVEGADETYAEFGATLRELFQQDRPVIVLCAAGIVIRALAPLLQDKRAEPPVLAVAEDGSAVVPLLGGLRGANALARQVASALGTTAAITTTGEIRFGLTLEDLPQGYRLQNPADGKRFLADLIAGATVRIEGDAPWLAASRLPRDKDGALRITLTPEARVPAAGELVIHPQSVTVSVTDTRDGVAARIDTALATARLSPLAVACLVAREGDAASPALHEAAAKLGVTVRLVPVLDTRDSIGLAVSAKPVDPETIGRARGRLGVVGLGPGTRDLLTPAAREALAGAQDILGYKPYVAMAGPFRAGQTAHASDNREELDRARHAFALAATGRNVAVVSSGDPGVFAMAAAVLEALEASTDPAWRGVELRIVPGISAAFAAAAQAGAPLGHDFCVLSLSDNLKPWSVIEQRLEAAGQADLVLALYNPISQARPAQFGRAMEILRRHRKPETIVVLGHNIGRPEERLTTTTLGALRDEQVDMRTVVLVGSSATRAFLRAEGGQWVFTPRFYRP